MTVTYDFSSKDVELEAKFSPTTVKLTTNASGGSAVGFSVSTFKNFTV